MSVLTIPPENLNYIKAGIVKAAYNTTVNEFYFYPIAAHFKDKDIEKESKRLVSSWANLNMKSYCLKYKDDDFINLSEFMPNYPNKKPAYDKGGAYWGIGSQLRVRYTKDLSYIEFYRN